VLGYTERRTSATILKTFGEKGGSRIVGYSRRRSVEKAFSTYKHLYGKLNVKKHRKYSLRAKSKSVRT
jgi:hypothetical protein